MTIAHKPKGPPYKHRMGEPARHWLIWSNKWGCWYRANSAGYTQDVLQAGIYTRDEALQHYEPTTPRKNRCTEPFPLTAVRRDMRRAVDEARERLATAVMRAAMLDERIGDGHD